MKRFLSFTLLFSFYGYVCGQTTGALDGIVLSGNTPEVLPGASVTLFYQGRVSGLIANKEGKFSIPAGTLYDSIKISMVGHRSRIYQEGQLNGTGKLDVSLDIAPAALQEVVVKPLTALDVIKKAIAKISVNQPRDNFENNGFYREIIRDKGNYFSVAEAVFLAQYFPDTKDYKLKLEQGRSKEDVSYTRLFEDFHPGGGPQAVAGAGFITGRPEFLNLREINKFRYKIDSIVQFDSRWLYQISFDQKPDVKEALEKGYVLIDTEDDAVVQYDVQNSPLGTAYIKNLTGTDKLFAEILKIDFKRKGWKRHVDFARVKEKWIMSYAETEYAILYKQPKKDLDLDLIISIELAFTDLYKPIASQISKGEEWKKKDIVANLPSAFDAVFWGNHPIISPTEKVKKIIADISKNNNEIPAAAAIAGWTYLNRNLFVTYRRDDTISLVPVMKCDWQDDATGGLLFREMDSDFVVESKVCVVKNSDEGSLPDKGFQQAGIIVRSTKEEKENYVFLSMGTGGNPNPKLFFKRTINNKSKTVVEKRETMSGWMRLEKSGHKIIAYFKDDNAAVYKKTGEYQLDWLNGKVQLGLAVFAAFTGDGPKMKPDMKAHFSQLKILSM